jgi:HK97 gp10 family phage protein
MANFQRSSVEGAKELDAALKELDTQVATRLGVAADRAAAKVAEDKLKAAAPYLPGTRLHHGNKNYGHLRDNIKARKGRSKNTNYIVFDVTTKDAFWGYFLEFGTSKMPARPWARPAVEAMKDELVQVQIDVLGKGINRIAKGVAKGTMLPNGRRA